MVETETILPWLSVLSLPWMITPQGIEQMAPERLQSGESPLTYSSEQTPSIAVIESDAGHSVDTFINRLMATFARMDATSEPEWNTSSVLVLIKEVGIQYSVGRGMPKALHSSVKLSDSFFSY